MIDKNLSKRSQDIFTPNLSCDDCRCAATFHKRLKCTVSDSCSRLHTSSRDNEVEPVSVALSTQSALKSTPNALTISRLHLTLQPATEAFYLVTC